MGLIDTWERDTSVPLDYFLQTERLLIRGNCSAWLNFSDSLSTYQGELFRLIKLLRQSVHLSGGIVYFSQTNFRLVGG